LTTFDDAVVDDDVNTFPSGEENVREEGESPVG
jgi:hypothetical protein